MCHKHILQQEIKLYKIVKDPYIILMFIPKICYILETFDMGNVLKHQKMLKFWWKWAIKKPMMYIMLKTKTVNETLYHKKTNHSKNSRWLKK
jgi:hypothetical protein